MMARLAIAGGAPVIPAGYHRQWPDIVDADRTAITRVLDSGLLWGANAPEVTALQDEWAEFCGTRFCLAVNSGTAALHCCLVAAGVGPGDEVIVPAFTMSATAMAVVHAGARPVFCDIEPTTFNIDPEKIEALITPRTRALMPVHMHGVVGDMARLSDIATANHLAILEDAAQAHGARRNNQLAGTFGVCAGFSLNGAKNLSAGEGGLFVTNDAECHRAARRLAIFGEDTPPLTRGEVRAFWNYGIGWNYRIHELTAALARSQLTRLAAYNATARHNASILTDGLTDLAGITPPHVPPECESTYHRYRVRLDPSVADCERCPREFRDRVLFALQREGVAAATWQTQPVPASPAFRRAPYAPWQPGTPAAPMPPWHPGQYDETVRLLDSSIVIGPEAQPLYVQSPKLMTMYVEAFHKVMNALDVVMASDYEPVRLQPSAAA